MRALQIITIKSCDLSLFDDGTLLFEDVAALETTRKASWTLIFAAYRAKRTQLLFNTNENVKGHNKKANYCE
jgi:hypothetical protein